LPNYILKWIGGPQTGDEYGQMAAQVRGVISSGAGGMAEGMRGLDQANAGVAQAITKGKEEAKEKAGSGDITGTGAGGAAP
jgi:hypothetical protein